MLGARTGASCEGTGRARVGAVVALGLAVTAAVLLLPPIPQDPAYHAFADRRTIDDGSR